MGFEVSALSQARARRLIQQANAIFSAIFLVVGGLVVLSMWSLPSLADEKDVPLMSVLGNFSVSPQGAATYSIPIKVPPGTSGMTPIVSLDYSSEGGDGIVGIGWGLSIGFPDQPFSGTRLMAPIPTKRPDKPLHQATNGIFGDVIGSYQKLEQNPQAPSGKMLAIERCARTVAQDTTHGGVNYDSNDRFCINGKRLILISGTYGANGSQYRTEIEEFYKITANTTSGTNPDSFEVRNRYGQILQFGYTTDSRILAVGTSIARAWALNKVTDPKGNYFTLTYTNDSTNGQFYPTQIDYTGNAGASVSPYASVQFSYTTRGDIVPKYKAGSLQKTTVILTHIKTYYGANLIYDYQLGYRTGTSTVRSRLTSVTLCDASSNCIAPTTFTWQGGSGSVSASTSAVGTTDLATGGYPYPGVVPGDFNGDGLTDAIGAYGTNCSTHGAIYYGNTSGSSFTAANMVLNVSGSTQYYCWGQADGLGDFDGDGWVDVIKAVSGNTNTYTFLNNHSNSFNNAHFIGSSGMYPPPDPIYDFNGDGRVDQSAMGYSNGDGTFSGSPIMSYDPVASYFGDFDGDGCEDYLTEDIVNNRGQITYMCSPATATYTGSAWPGSLKQLVFGDFNGDGLTDVLFISGNQGVGPSAMYLSTGTGLVQTSFSVPTNWDFYSIVVGDWNGDGKADIALIAPYAYDASGGPYSHSLWLSTGDAFSSATTVSNTSSSDDCRTTSCTSSGVGIFGTAADWNNDGASDIWLSKTSGAETVMISYTPELMTAIGNGLGATTTITYDRINKGSPLYTKGSGASYPTKDDIGPMYVVSQVDRSDGVGGNYTTTYAYEAAKRDLSGRNFLGFAKVTATDTETNIVTATSYETAFPKIGKVSSQTLVHSGTTIESTTNTFTPTNSGVAPTFVPLTSNVVAKNDLNGTAFPTVTTTYTYDSYGNVTQAQISATGITRTINRTYVNDTTNWILGKPDTKTVTSDVTGSAGTSLPSYSAYVGPSGNIWGSFNWGSPNNW